MKGSDEREYTFTLEHRDVQKETNYEDNPI